MTNRSHREDLLHRPWSPSEPELVRPLLFRGQWFDLDSYLAIADAADAIAASVLPLDAAIPADPATSETEESVARIELEGGPILARAPPRP